MEKIKNKYAKTMLIEAKYSLISKGYPIDEEKIDLESLNYDAFKVALKEKIKNLRIKNKEIINSY